MVKKILFCCLFVELYSFASAPSTNNYQAEKDDFMKNSFFIKSNFQHLQHSTTQHVQKKLNK
ncbi:MAG: hypothetical protein WC747_02465 [Candidatus Babeliales bacterium]|jgi:hypothetical protein